MKKIWGGGICISVSLLKILEDLSPVIYSHASVYSHVRNYGVLLVLKHSRNKNSKIIM